MNADRNTPDFLSYEHISKCFPCWQGFTGKCNTSVTLGRFVTSHCNNQCYKSLLDTGFWVGVEGGHGRGGAILKRSMVVKNLSGPVGPPPLEGEALGDAEDITRGIKQKEHPGGCSFYKGFG